ncbi:hypothetical protein SH2C18_27590 [Clostridium sediminicola]|uniref:hypothetical protein n=1 Tax=Clostridium sediminicola TaxID=3114879 RepID=UPI0031F1F726
MVKSIIAYQRLLFNTLSMNRVENHNPLKLIGTIFGIFIMILMNGVIFGWDSPLTFMIIFLPALCVWEINMIFHEKERLFEYVPVTRKFTVVNTFIFAIILGISLYIILTCGSLLLFHGIIDFIIDGELNAAPVKVIMGAIDMGNIRAYILMFIVLIIVLIVGTAIVFIKKKGVRTICYLGEIAIGYGLLYFLRLNLPLAPYKLEVHFMESFSAMPQANIILILATIVGTMLCISSVVFGNKMYK